MKKPIDVKRDSFDTMWSFLQMGGQKPNIPGLKKYCETLQKNDDAEDSRTAKGKDERR